MAEHTEFKDAFSSHDGVKIFYRKFQASDERARMVVAHGLGEHSGRYGNVVSRLLPAGFTLWIPDHRGHGQSGGRKGHVLNFEQYILDLRMLVEMVREDLAPGTKVFLLGHSMGGLIALCFALQSPELIDGVIASSPALGVAVEVPAVKNFLGKIMSFIWPGLQMSNELDASKISRDKRVVEAYVNDPLMHDRVSARWFTEILSTMAEVNGRASGLQVPVLMQVAGDDHLASAESSRRFFENLTVDDKTLYFYDDLYHEVYNELEDQRLKVLDDLASWLEKHL